MNNYKEKIKAFKMTASMILTGWEYFDPTGFTDSKCRYCNTPQDITKSKESFGIHESWCIVLIAIDVSTKISHYEVVEK